MKTRNGKKAGGTGSLALWSAAFALCAAPLAALGDEPMSEDVKALVVPTNHVEIGVMGVTDDSTKFGEYSGLDESGPYAVGNLDVRGGNAYGMGSGTFHWDLHGVDLGTTSRSVGGSVGVQGQWSLGIDFDQLRHYTTDGYQTPYIGSMGGNTFTLLPSFGVISRPSSSSPGSRALTTTQLSSFHNEDVYTERQNTTFKGSYDINRWWNAHVRFNHLEQTGAKLIGAPSDEFNGGPGGFNYRGEAVAILMNPTKYQTDTLDLGVSWTGEKGFMSFGYEGTFFHDDFKGVNFSNVFVSNNVANGTNPGAPFPTDTMSLPPSNQYHQLSLSGGYHFTPATQFAGKVSIGRNTQDESFAGTYTTLPNTTPGLPVNSLDGVVQTLHGDLRVTHHATRALTLEAGAKYDKRDNQTPSNTYTFLDLGGSARTVVNAPMSNERFQADAAGDYRISHRQRVRIAYQYDSIRRWCDNTLANHAQGATPAYYTTPSCAQVPHNDEHKVSLLYRLRATDNLHLRAGYAYSTRDSTVNPSFYNPMQGHPQGYENFGYLAYFQQSRIQHAFKAGLNWAPTERMNVELSGKYAKDAYDSILGVQDGNTASANLDVSYSLSNNNVVSAFGSFQRRSRGLLTAHARNPFALPGEIWTNDLVDWDGTLGINAKQKRLMAGKLALTEELTYQLARSRYSTIQFYTTPGSGNDGETPTVESESIRFRLTGDYKVDKHSSIVVGYIFQYLNSNDYFYNAYQYGFTPNTILPSNQMPPDYTDNAIYAAYRYGFQ